MRKRYIFLSVAALLGMGVYADNASAAVDSAANQPNSGQYQTVNEGVTFSLLNGSPASYGEDLTLKVLDGTKVVTEKTIKKTTEEFPSLANSGVTLSENDGLVKGHSYQLKLFAGKDEMKVIPATLKFGDKANADFSVDAQALLVGKRTFKIVNEVTGKPVNTELTEIPNLSGTVKENQKIVKHTDNNGLVTVATDDSEFMRGIIYHFDIAGYEQDGEMNFNLIGGEKGDKIEEIKVKPIEQPKVVSEGLTFSLLNGSPASYGKDLTLKVLDGAKVVAEKTIKKTTEEFPNLANSGVTLSENDGLVKGHSYQLKLFAGKDEMKVIPATLKFGDKANADFSVDAQALLVGKRTFKIVNEVTGKPVNTELTEIPNLSGTVKENQKIVKHTDNNGLVTVSTDDSEFMRGIIYHFDIAGYEQDGEMNFNLIGGEKGDKIEEIKVKPIKGTDQAQSSQIAEPVSEPAVPTTQPSTQRAVNQSKQQPTNSNRHSTDLLATTYVKGRKTVRVSGNHRFYKNYHLNKWVKTKTNKHFVLKAKLLIKKNNQKLTYNLISDHHGHRYVIFAGFVH